MSKFVIKQGKSGPHFNLVAGNGEVIGTSEVYNSTAACKSGIESVRKNSGVHVEDHTKEGFETVSNPKFELYKDRKGEFRFRLKARNGETILTSEGYSSKEGCKGGIASVGKNAPDAEIKEG